MALWTYEFFSVDDIALENCLRDFYENTVGPYWPPERSYVKAHYKTLPFPFEKEITPPPFKQMFFWNMAQLLGYFRSWSAVKQYNNANGRDPVEELEKTLMALWGDPNSSKLITMPIYLRVARV